MTAYTSGATTIIQPRTGLIGVRELGIWQYARAATANATGDTVTWSTPINGNRQKLIGGTVEYVSFDSNASPGTFILGTSGDTDGFLTATPMGNTVATGRLVYVLDGALVGTVLNGDESFVLTLGTIGTATTGARALLKLVFEAA